MPRVKRGVTARQRHKKLLKQTKGYYSQGSRSYRIAKQYLIKALLYAFRDRKQRKRDFRGLWIIRINAGCRECGLAYSRFINGLKKANIGIDRKVLADLAIHNKKAFSAIVEQVKAVLEPKKD
jgi:large subunit ribosomal protein L20